MGAPYSGIFSEIFLQYMKLHTSEHLTKTNMFINYFCYIDNNLIFDSAHTNIQSNLPDFNSIHPSFTAETEQNNAIIYHDIYIHKTEHSIQTAIYRTPTFTVPLSLTHQPYQFNNEYNHKINFTRNILYNNSLQSNH